MTIPSLFNSNGEGIVFSISTAPTACKAVILSPRKSEAKSTADSGSRYPQTATV